MLNLVIQVASASGEIIAVAVTGFSAWVGYKQLQKKPEQVDMSTTSPSAQNEPEMDPGVVFDSLVVFESDTQRTTLRVTSDSLECYLFDSRPEKNSSVQWRLSAEKAKEILNSNDFGVSSGYKIKTGTFRIGERRKWLYSKMLFPEPKMLEKRIRVLLSRFHDA